MNPDQTAPGSTIVCNTGFKRAYKQVREETTIVLNGMKRV